MEDKRFFIEAYFADLENRIRFLEKLDGDGRKDEALMLCCCYIEALGSLQYETEKKARNYSRILSEHGGNEIFALVHPLKLRRVLSDEKLSKYFKESIPKIEKIIDEFGEKLINSDELLKKLLPIVDGKQASWLQENIYKWTLATISYELVRSKLVHEISAAPVTFSKIIHKGVNLPDINFYLMYPALFNIFRTLKAKSLDTNKWFGKQ